MNNNPGTLVKEENKGMESVVVRGVSIERNQAEVTIDDVPDRPGVSAAIFGAISDANIMVDMIVQNVSHDGQFTDLTFTVPATDLDRTMKVLENVKAQIGYSDLRGATDIVKVSVIGVGMRSHAGVAAQMFKALADKGINIEAISTSEIKISVLIDSAYAELAVRTLHSLYGLDAA